MTDITRMWWLYAFQTMYSCLNTSSLVIALFVHKTWVHYLNLLFHLPLFTRCLFISPSLRVMVLGQFKCCHLSLGISWILGKPTKQTYPLVLSPLLLVVDFLWAGECSERERREKLRILVMYMHSLSGHQSVMSLALIKRYYEKRCIL